MTQSNVLDIVNAHTKSSEQQALRGQSPNCKLSGAYDKSFAKILEVAKTLKDNGSGNATQKVVRKYHLVVSPTGMFHNEVFQEHSKSAPMICQGKVDPACQSAWHQDQVLRCKFDVQSTSNSQKFLYLATYCKVDCQNFQ